MQRNHLKSCRKQLCHLFLKRIGTKDAFLNANSALVESLSNQIFPQPCCQTCSIAIIKPEISASKTGWSLRLPAKQPIKGCSSRGLSNFLFVLYFSLSITFFFFFYKYLSTINKNTIVKCLSLIHKK